VGKEFRSAVEELNLSLPLELQIRYFALDYTRASNGKSYDRSNKGHGPGPGSGGGSGSVDPTPKGVKKSTSPKGMREVGLEWATLGK
jgi:hypothetical protein